MQEAGNDHILLEPVTEKNDRYLDWMHEEGDTAALSCLGSMGFRSKRQGGVVLFRIGVHALPKCGLKVSALCLATVYYLYNDSTSTLYFQSVVAHSLRSAASRPRSRILLTTCGFAVDVVHFAE